MIQQNPIVLLFQQFQVHPKNPMKFTINKNLKESILYQQIHQQILSITVRICQLLMIKKISLIVMMKTNKDICLLMMPKLNVIKQEIFHYFSIHFVFLADVQEEKLVVLTTEINAKQKCLEMLENARKRSDLIRQRYEERIKTLSERIQNAEDEKQAAVTKLSKFIY